MSNINDVCKLAGVSKATVSRVINDIGQVRESTREKVFAAMKELDYRPNKLAQALATNKTNSIALVVSNFDGVHFGLLLKQVASSLEQAKMQFIVTDGHNNPEDEYEAVRQLEGRCDAVVLYSRTLSGAHINKLAQELTVPVVVINRASPELLFHSVYFDQEGAITMMMNHLISYGHRKIACITGPLDNLTGKARLAGYNNALKNFNISTQPGLIVSGDYHMMSGYYACKELLSKNIPFSALLAFNDNMALGALKALTEAGIKVPEEVSIAGIDNDPVTEFFTPALTTLKLPIEAMAKQAVEVAITLCNQPVPITTHQYKGELVQRESVMPLHAQKNWLNL